MIRKKYRMIAAVFISAMALKSNVCCARGLLDDFKNIAKDVGKEVSLDVFSDLTGSDLDSIIDDTAGMWDSLSGKMGDQITGSIIDTLCKDALSWMNITDETAAEQLRNIFFTLTDRFEVDSETTEDIWASIADFAEKNDIDTVVATKLAVATIVRTTMEDGFTKEKASEYIQDNVTDWIVNSITDNEDAQGRLEKMNDIISEYIAQ